MDTDTIAAIATPLSNSGIGIIRISGPEAFSVIGRIFRKKNGKEIDWDKSHQVHYGWIVQGEEILDEVLVLVMKGPHSYTAEDTAEIDCHGGSLMMKRILETVLRHGARPAKPGEFTKRAFLNGRMDLSQAEAVMDVIQAQNDYALKASVSQLKGSVSNKIRVLREGILYQIAYIESALDDPEHISLEGYGNQLFQAIRPIKEEIEGLIRSFEQGRVMTEGIKTVILGKPNAGKSSLMNVLLGQERAIVTDIAGTTRDTLEEKLSLDGITLHIIDTAGIRETEDVVEKIGVDKAKKYVEDADLIIYVVDTSTALDENDFEIMELLRDRTAIVLMNKSDLTPVTTAEEVKKHLEKTVISISVKEQVGIEELEEKIKELFFAGEVSFNDEVYITNIRHKTALQEALHSLHLVVQSISDGMPEDFYSIDLMNAYEELGSIIGEAVEDDLVEEIFSKFCMGK